MMAAVLLLLGIGVATILSATYSGRNSGLEVKQVYWILIGLVALLVCVSVDYLPLARDGARADPALRVREAGGGAVRGQDLRRVEEGQPRHPRHPGPGSGG